ncbi:tRNA lysidine(34) synthetase TilS [Sporomusa aerivorans]|uniref:tRNA lysidine(34) synthetase TilS n=1 Tax=Sporomusa aerivorans TaxID=204936 RepID=UPI00352A3C50
MLAIIKKWVENHSLFIPGSRILAACSGGPDSLALVHILNAFKEEYSFQLAVAHVNHMFRPEAVAEAEFVACFAAGLGLGCHVTAIDVPAYYKANKMSPEEAGRILRYQYLRSVAAEWGGALIATGHHRDDQVETVLINFLRGAGSGGLRGIQPASDGIIRPLLPVSRREIEKYCALWDLKPCQDNSNFTTDYLRNRIRLKLIPALEAGYNPAIRKAVWRLAMLAGDEHDFLRQEAGRQWPIVITEADRLTIDSQALAKLHKALQREIIRQAIEKKRGSLTGISFDHVEKLLTMVISGTVGSVMLLPGGLKACKTYTGLELGLKEVFELQQQPFSTESSLAAVQVAVPGITQAGGFTITAELVTRPRPGKCRQTAAFDLERLSLPLTVRTRRPGDKFRPAGLNGSKKLKEFFIDQKVLLAERDSVLLISDQQEIIWVAGYRQAERGRILSTTKKILQLSITKREEF